MSIPTFNSQALVSRAARDMPACPRVRIHAETMPGIDGLYVQPHGSAQREITVRGILEAQGESAVLAHQQLKRYLRDKQAMADGKTVSTYVGTDATQYPHCMLQTYEASDKIRVSPGESTFEAFVPIEANILQLAP